MAEEVDAAKMEAVVDWLRTVYGDQSLPSFEVTPRTVEVLYQLAELNKQRNVEVEEKAANARAQAHVYEGEADRFEDLLRRIGLAPSTLPTSVSSALTSLARAGDTLALTDPSDANFFHALMKMAEERDALDDTIRKIELRREELRKAIQALEEEEVQVQRSMANAQADLASREATVVELGVLAERGERKASQYAVQRAQATRSCRNASLRDDIRHGALVELAERVDDLRKATEPLTRTLEAYRGLPADRNLAELKLEERRRELAGLEEEITRRLQDLSLHLTLQ